MPDSQFPAFVHGKIVIFDDAHSLDAFDGLADDVEPLVHVEESALVLVDADCYHYFVKHRESPLENVEMPCGKRVEGPREQCLAHIR